MTIESSLFILYICIYISLKDTREIMKKKEKNILDSFCVNELIITR